MCESFVLSETQLVLVPYRPLAESLDTMPFTISALENKQKRYTRQPKPQLLQMCTLVSRNILIKLNDYCSHIAVTQSNKIIF